MNKIVDETTEDVVLGSLILNPSEYNAVAQYIPDIKVFSQKKARALWIKVSKMIKSSAHVDTLTVCTSITSDDRLQGLSQGYVVDCTNGGCALGMTEVYAQTIYEKYLLRKIADETDKIRNNVINHGENVYEMISSAHTLMGELIRVRPGDKFSIDVEISDTLKTMRDGSRRMIKTGYKEIDNLAGGLTRGEITIVGGRPGHGKTTLLVNLLASLVTNGYKVAMFNRELPNTEVIKKLLCIEYPKLHYDKVRRGIIDATDVKFISKLKKASRIIKSKYSEDKFIMFDNIRDLPKTASEIKKFKPDVIIDDYIQLIKPVGREDNRRLQLEKICNDYKWLAKENNCSVILASQLNRYLEARGRESKRPQLSDLAECGAIEQIAENVLFIYYPHKVNPSIGTESELQLYASKVRYGKTKDIELGYKGHICTVYDDWSIKNFQEPKEKDEEEQQLTLK